MAIEAIIFDMDGTISDTTMLWATATDIMVRRHANMLSDMQRAELHRQVHGLALRESCALIKAHAQSSHSIDMLIADKQRVALELYNTLGITFISGFVEFHAQVTAAALKMGIATNADEGTLAATTRALNLVQFFGEHIYAIAAVNNRCKPSPDIYLHAADKLGTHPRACIAIEDSAHGVAAAKAAGMRCIGINTAGDRKQLSQADLIVDSYNHINLAWMRVNW